MHFFMTCILDYICNSILRSFRLCLLILTNLYIDFDGTT